VKNVHQLQEERKARLRTIVSRHPCSLLLRIPKITTNSGLHMPSLPLELPRSFQSEASLVAGNWWRTLSVGCQHLRYGKEGIAMWTWPFG